uniref:Uncharacterized protein LOC108951039 n=1 Tax=Phallusia mammillata TaxID=59560 RepID=A0A6F9DJN1_9ASCI|nr:uncharacterized protein LOC108951039 [Phallusia mammillata]
MAYILYCHYEEFAEIQQTYHVTISWSGIDNSVIFCATSRSDRELLTHAAQRFLDFYYDVISTLVAVPLSKHVTNVTLHQFHRATYEVKKFHPKVMVKEVGKDRKLVIYCSVDEIDDSKRTFLSALCTDVTPSGTLERRRTKEKSTASRRSETIARRNPKMSELAYRTLPSNRGNPFYSEDSWPDVSQSSRSFTPRLNYKHYSDAPIPHDNRLYDTRTKDYDTSGIYGHSRLPSPRRESADETVSTNSSSGYGSAIDTSQAYFRSYDVNPRKHYATNYHKEPHFSKRPPVLPPTAHLDPLMYTQPGQRHTLRRTPTLRSPNPLFESKYEVTSTGGSPYMQRRTPHSIYRNDNSYATMEARPRFVIGDDVARLKVESPPMRPNTGPLRLPLEDTYRRSPNHRGSSYTQLTKPSVIPKLKSPFQFKQMHKVYFETTTPTGIEIEIHEGDVTDTECDVIVNETNSQLHVTGELAWAVAKHGAFEIPKLTKLHVSMHGPVPECKVIVTPSVGLPSGHIIHAVTPKWHANDTKKCRKQLYNTYKNIFNTANVDLQARSIALPVVGISSSTKTIESYPFHVATEVMYQALIAFLKLGSPSLRHIRYVSSDPDQVNLIVTSIKPKIENVSYDARFLRQQRKAVKKLAKTGGSMT